MQEKSVCLLPSQRTQRAENLKKKLMPRAVAVFPVVSENVTKFKAGEKQLWQLEKQSIEQTELNPTKSDENKYRKYDKIEVE